MEHTNPTIPPPPPGNPNPQQGNPYQQQGNPYQQQGNPYQQQGNPYQQFNQFGGQQQDLPNAGGVLTLGILGIIFSLGLFGIIFNIIALALAGGAVNKFKANPGMYTEASFKRVKAGRTCAIIGLSLFGAGLLIIIAANA